MSLSNALYFLFHGHWRQCMAASLLTPDALRCPTLSMASHKEGKKNKNFLRPLYRLRYRGQTSAAMSGEFTPADITANAGRSAYSPRMQCAVRPSLWQAIKRVKKIKTSSALFTACGREGRRAQRCRVSLPRRTLAPMQGGEFTHPGCVALSDPLYGKP